MTRLSKFLPLAARPPSGRPMMITRRPRASRAHAIPRRSRPCPVSLQLTRARHPLRLATRLAQLPDPLARPSCLPHTRARAMPSRPVAGANHSSRLERLPRSRRARASGARPAASYPQPASARVADVGHLSCSSHLARLPMSRSVRPVASERAACCPQPASTRAAGARRSALARTQRAASLLCRPLPRDDAQLV